MSLLKKIFSFFSSKDLKSYELKIIARGEDMEYKDNDIELYLERSYCSGHRLYCRNTDVDKNQNPITLSKRLEIMDNLCDYFKTKEKETIFVLEVADKDRTALLNHIDELKQEGHLLKTEDSSPEIRNEFTDIKNLRWIKSGKTIQVGDIEIKTIEDYEKHKDLLHRD